MSTLQRVVILIAAALCVCLAAVPLTAQEAVSGPMPAWVREKPQDTDTAVYFLGMGFSADGALAAALEFAHHDVTSQIVKFIGVRVTSATSIAAAGTLDELKASITRQIKETSSSYHTGVRLEKTPWYEKNSRGLTVYILVSCEREALIKEKKRWEALIQTMIDSVRIPEEEGDRLSAAGRYYEAALRYIDAAVAAGKAETGDDGAALERNLASAMAAVGKINLVKLNDNLAGVSGEGPSEPFRLKAAAGPVAAPGVPRTAVLVAFDTAPAAGTAPVVKTVLLTTDDDGVLEFRLPVFTFAGTGKVVMRLALDSYLEKLASLKGGRSNETIAALMRLTLSKKQEFRFVSRAPASHLPFALCVIDVDENGVPLPESRSTASGLCESLSRRGFTLSNAALDPLRISQADERELAALISAQARDARRAVVGIASLVDAYQDQDHFIVTVTGTIKVLDLHEKKIIYERTMRKKCVGATLAAGRTAAFKELGRELGLKIASEAH